MMKTLALTVLFTAASAAGAAELEITVAPAEQIERVRVVERLPNTMKKINRRWFDAAPAGEKGHFIVEDLPEGVYDICIETVDHRIEGVDLTTGAGAEEPAFCWWLPGERLAAENFDPATVFEEGAVVTEEEKAEAIRKKFRLDALRKCLDTITKVARFENYVRVIYAAGTPEKAKALVELRRDGGHYAARGDEVIWRSEIWTFVWAYGAWVAQNRSAKVLERFRLQRTEYEQLERLYDPRIGGISLKEGEKTTVVYQLPEVLDDKMGKAGTTRN
ncbi:MAG: hypothetical protein HQ592_14750 [Planctomycetes bacterium]|nr:hypothetical protein [Planctomycetota bacterium]